MAKFRFGELPTTPGREFEENGVTVVEPDGIDGEKLTLRGLVVWAEEARQRNGFESWSVYATSEEPGEIKVYFSLPQVVKKAIVGVARAVEPGAK